MELVFVYNANSGKLNAYLDSLHKIVSPKTYPCSLCDLTYGVFKIRPEWKNFRETAGLEMVFYHIDEFNLKYPNKRDVFEYPVVLKNEEESLDVFIDKTELDSLKTDLQLIDLIQSKLL